MVKHSYITTITLSTQTLTLCLLGTGGLPCRRTTVPRMSNAGPQLGHMLPGHSAVCCSDS